MLKQQLHQLQIVLLVNKDIIVQIQSLLKLPVLLVTHVQKDYLLLLAKLSVLLVIIVRLEASKVFSVHQERSKIQLHKHLAKTVQQEIYVMDLLLQLKLPVLISESVLLIQSEDRDAPQVNILHLELMFEPHDLLVNIVGLFLKLQEMIMVIKEFAVMDTYAKEDLLTKNLLSLLHQ